eukprot:superscaffoldBa00000169_g2380
MFTLIILGLCVCLFLIQLITLRPKNFPPGPIILPLLGNVLNISLENPLNDFERLRKAYGNVYSLYIGSKPAVFINGLKAMKEAMVSKATDFAGRPQDLFVNDTTNRRGVILADYGSSWREHRRFALMTLRNFGLGKQSMEERILGEMQYVMNTLEKSIGKTLSPQLMFHNAASNIICQVLFGKRYDYDDEFITVLVQCFTENAKLANGPWAMLYDSFPMIRNLPLPFSKAFKNVKRCQQEIDQVLEGKDRASFEDRNNMPYMQAVIHEVQRIANTVPLSVFHCTTKDTELMGYSIPKGTMIIPNLTSVLKEEGQWKFPHEFNPENFLNDQGEFVKPEAFMPFSAGPRMCLGEGLARMELFLIMVTLLRKFKFIWPEDAGEPDYTPVYGVTLTPKPYRMKIELRATQCVVMAGGGTAGVDLSRKFVSEAELDERRKKRQEEWEKVRKPDDPENAPEEEYDPRSLFERLQEQKDKKQEEFEEQFKFSGLHYGSFTLTLYCHSALAKQASADSRSEPEKKSAPKHSGAEQRTSHLSQAHLLAGAVKRRSSSQSSDSSKKQKVEITSATTGNGDRHTEQEGGAGGEARGAENQQTVPGLTAKTPPAPLSSGQGVLHLPSAAVCVGVLPGLWVYSGSSDSDSSSDSEGSVDAIMSPYPRHNRAYR